MQTLDELNTIQVEAKLSTFVYIKILSFFLELEKWSEVHLSMSNPVTYVRSFIQSLIYLVNVNVNFFEITVKKHITKIRLFWLVWKSKQVIQH